MDEAFQAFMEELIDYAGLFPPARLDLDEALGNYMRHREEHASWMLGRFIVPAVRLKELLPYGDELFISSSEPFPFSIIVGGGASDFDQIRSFNERFGSAVSVEALETLIPLEAKPYDYLARLLDAAPKGSKLFAESLDFDTVIPAIAKLNRDAPRNAAFKVRCGGLKPEAFPPPERIASIIALCRDEGVPLKCTAGLHHPVRLYSETFQTMMHGFLNIFGAGILAYTLRWSHEEILACLLDEEGADFSFHDAHFVWKEHAVPADAVRKTRAGLMTGFGSCSFDEPREDLKALGLLKER